VPALKHVRGFLDVDEEFDHTFTLRRRVKECARPWQEKLREKLVAASDWQTSPLAESVNAKKERRLCQTYRLRINSTNRLKP
jgi:hypothetical protein